MLKQRELGFVAAMCSGLAFAFYIFGPGVINPFDVQWVLKGGDAYQHFIGQAFFLSDVWRWPLGLNPGFGSEFRGSIVFTDSIPLAALIAKMVVPAAVQPVQIQGIVLALNFMLTAGIAYLLCNAIVGNSYVSLLVSVLLMSSTIMTMRGAGAHGHESLTAHWTFLLAMLFFAKDSFDGKLKENLKWTALLCLVALIHFYLLVVCLCFYAAEIARHALRLIRGGDHERLPMLVCHVATAACMLLFFMYASGYFVFSVDTEKTSVYGDFPASLLAFLNPKSNAWFLQGNPLKSLSVFFEGRSPAINGDYEGQAYLGLGLIVLAVMALFAFIAGGVKLSHLFPLMLVCFVLSVFAVSNRIAFFDQVRTIPLNDRLLSLLGLVRSSGRLIWPMFHLIAIMSAYILSRKMPASRLVVLLVGLMLVQFVDLHGWHQSLYVRNRDASSVYVDGLRDNHQFQSIIGRATEVNLYPVDYVDDYQVYAWEAYKSRIPINTGYFARTPPSEAYKSANARLQSQIGHCRLMPGVLYVIRQVKAEECAGPDILVMRLDKSLLMLRPR